MNAPRLLTFLLVTTLPCAAETIETDLFIYGGTSGGIAAALQAKRMGKTAAIAEWTGHLGGLTTGGLGATDIGNKGAIGGIAREFYEAIYDHYQKPESWKWEKPATSATNQAKQNKGGDAVAEARGKGAKWTFEPSVALAIYQRWLADADIPVRLHQRLASVKKDGTRLTEVTMEDGTVYRARMFLDASYEGDLMARAGVAYHVGREANATWNESINGVRARTPKHQFLVDVDPWKVPGDPASGLLPFIQAGDGGQPGAGDKAVQAYNFRLCMTRTAANRLPWRDLRPDGYEESRFELCARLIEAHEKAGKPLTVGQLMNPVMMPNDKTDTNNNGAFSTDAIGMNYDYPEADYARREAIIREHADYTKGFLYFLATSPRVPQRLREEMNQWGLARDEFTENGNWPTQMYVREARRMISGYVMTEADCRWERKAEDPVGLGAYNMDSHNCQRLVQNGVVRNEGDVQDGVQGPYGVSYRSLIPRPAEATNLFVPVAMAATHIAYGSIRMEPVFMILSQSAATAAVMAMESGVTPAEVPYPALRERLLADHQILTWSAPASAPRGRSTDPATLPGVVLDDTAAAFTGDWVVSSSVPSVGDSYRHDNNTDKGEATATFTPEIPAAGEYEVVLLFPALPNRATNVPVTITIDGKPAGQAAVNQRQTDRKLGSSAGRYTLPAGKSVSITVSTAATDGFVIVDGLQLLPVK